MYAMEQVLSVIGLLIIIPFCLEKLRMHELALQMFVCLSMAAGLTCAGLSRNLFPEFILSILVTSTHTWQWSLARSVFTKMVGKAEVGKVFTVLGLMGSLLPLAATPLYKKLYNATIATVPATFFYYTACAYLVALVLVIFLFCYRNRFTVGQNEEDSADAEKDSNKNVINLKEAEVKS